MTRRTSAETFRQIEQSGLLSHMRWLVYRWLYSNGPATRSELEHGMATPGTVLGSMHKRLPELEALGVVAVVGERLCRVTGRQVIEWDVTDALPNKPAPRVSRIDRLTTELEELRARVERMEARAAPKQLHFTDA